MPDLDGVWNVERTSGALPPLYGVSKRIGGDTGETRLGPLRFPFEIRGLELRYVGLLSGLVDVLKPSENGFRGVATYRGRALGTFTMTRRS